MSINKYIIMVRKIVLEARSCSSVVMDNMNYCRSRPAGNSGPGGCSSITFYYVIQLPGQGYIRASGSGGPAI